MIRLSVTSKLDGIPSWSLAAIETCPGSLDRQGLLVPACQGCYATTGNYTFPNVKKVREENRLSWQDPNWVDDFCEKIKNQAYFRWFDSGDVYHTGLAEKIYQVMLMTPKTKHWLPTRMHKFKKFETILKKMEELPNVVVRRSSDSVTGEYQEGVHGSTIVPDYDHVPPGVTACGASRRGGRCGGCRACWNPEVKVIGYPAHGARMKKVIRIHKAKEAA